MSWQDYIDEMADIAAIEGAGYLTRGLADTIKTISPHARAAGALASGYTSYNRELDKLSKQDMNNLERYGRAGLVGLSDGLYGMIPFGNMFKDIAQGAIRLGAQGLANIGSNMYNNRFMDNLNEQIWSKK